jgi:hypothetical protein
VTNLTVSPGGTEAVKPGVTLSSPTIAAGVIMVISSGASLAGTVTVGNGVQLDMTGLSAFSGAVLSGFDGSDVIDLQSLTYTSAETATFTPNMTNTGGLLTVSNGSHAVSINLLGQYAAAGFSAVQDGGAGTVVTYTPPVSAHLLAVGH